MLACLAALVMLFLPFPDLQEAGVTAAPDTVTVVMVDPTAISDHFADIAEAVGPSVVTINSRTTVTATVPGFGMTPWGFYGFGPPQQREYTQRGLGSGVIVTGDGYIVTNHHVAGEVDELEVVLSTGEIYAAKLIASDSRTDLAVIRIEASDLPVIAMGQTGTARVGEWVLAIGSPFALSQTVTQGIISFLGREGVGLADYESYIQTDAAINPGNSGGALVNMRGELIGINTAIASRTGGNQGIGFAIPVEMVRNVMNDLISFGVVRRGWLGVTLQELSEELRLQFGVDDEVAGVVVSDVLAGTPASGSGILRGDIITAMEGEPVQSVASLRNRIAATPPETRVAFTMIREGRSREVRVTLGSQPGASVVPEVSRSFSEEAGWVLRELEWNRAEQLGVPGSEGVLIAEVTQNGSAEGAGLRGGDVILEVNRTRVGAPEEVEGIISNSTDNVLLLIWRDGGTFFTVLRL
ncbi:MAG: Do family serine endopeptidase [Candidatus Fermentibacteraceae bacterium]